MIKNKDNITSISTKNKVFIIKSIKLLDLDLRGLFYSKFINKHNKL